MTSLSNRSIELKATALTQQAIDSQFIRDTQGFYIKLSLLGIENLPEQLQFLANARYYLSVIYDEFIKIGKTQALNREKLINFSLNLWRELEKANCELVNCDNTIKELSQRLDRLADDLFMNLYADEETVSHISFLNLLMQTVEISRVLDLLCELVLSNKTKGGI